MSQPNAQISIWQDSKTNESHLEIPYGGGRKKIQLPQDPLFWGEIISAELAAQTIWLENQELKKKELERQKEIKTQEKKWKRTIEMYKRVHKDDPGMEMWLPKRTHIFTSDILINED